MKTRRNVANNHDNVYIYIYVNSMMCFISVAVNENFKQIYVNEKKIFPIFSETNFHEKDTHRVAWLSNGVWVVINKSGW